LDDWGFVDLWFLFSSKQKYVWKLHQTGGDNALMSVLFVGNLGIYGLAHGCLFGLLIEAQESFSSATFPRRTLWFVVALTCIGLFLLGTHAGFLYGGANRNWGQVFIGPFAILGVLLLSWLKKPIQTIILPEQIGPVHPVS
jgi:hypothetical protein